MTPAIAYYALVETQTACDNKGKEHRLGSCPENSKIVGRQKNVTDNRSAARKADKSPSRIAVAKDASPKFGDVTPETAVTNPQKRGRPRIGEPPRPKPWEGTGMSERTYYRRLKDQTFTFTCEIGRVNVDRTGWSKW